MKIYNIWAENVRGITKRITLEPSLTGVTLISAPNETGKTTMSEVLNFLFMYPSSSNRQQIKDLKPIGKDVGPAMGAKIEVNGQIYLINKQWLKDRKTEVELISPVKSQLSGNKAQDVIDEIFTEYLDETIWRLLQIEQAQFAKLTDDGLDFDPTEALHRLLDQVVSEGDVPDDATLMEKVDAEYFEWFAERGGRTKRAGSKGGALIDLLNEIGELRTKLRTLKTDIDGAAALKGGLGRKNENRDLLRRQFNAQQLEITIQRLQTKANQIENAKKLVESIVSDEPRVERFSDELFQNVLADRHFETAYNNLSSLKIKALVSFEITINGVSHTLEKDEVLDQKLESPLDVFIDEIAHFEYASNKSNDPEGIEVGHNRFLASLRDLGCKDFSEASSFKTKFDAFRLASDKFENLVSDEDVAHNSAELVTLSAERQKFKDWDDLISATPVALSQLEEAAEEVGDEKGQWTQISKMGWHEEHIRVSDKISDLEGRADRMQLEFKAFELLYKTLNMHKDEAVRDLSPVFAESLNALAESFYGEKDVFEVSEDFKVLSRHLNGTTVELKHLSTGAKEQVAILIRLALSRLVHRGESVPVFFDDEFGHSDPQRIATMGRVFSEFSEDQQFILLTCYPQKFQEFTNLKILAL